MQLSTVIFDMDGLLVDTEPLWQQAVEKVFKQYNLSLTHEQYISTTGLRTKEFMQWWFRHFNIANDETEIAGEIIMQEVDRLVSESCPMMPGLHYIIEFFYTRNFKIGVASSSHTSLIELVLKQCGLKPYVSGIASAEFLEYGKPHPQVYLNCAATLNAEPSSCICFEDSFNGMIAAKAARMKCVLVPHHSQLKDERWGAADLKISSLQNFGALHLNLLSGQ